MSQTWTPRGDFEAVVDTLEPVTWCSPSSAVVFSAQGWRFEESRSEYPGAGDLAFVVEGVWQLGVGVDCDAPRVGDRLVESNGSSHRVMSVDRLRAETRVRVRTRRIEIDRLRANRFRIEATIVPVPVAEPGPGGWRIRDASAWAVPLATSDSNQSWLVQGGVHVGDRLVDQRGVVTEIGQASPSAIVPDWSVVLEAAGPA